VPGLADRRRAFRWASAHGPSLLPAGILIGLMLVWAVHDGGYDADTWYWGALVTLSLLGFLGALGVAAGRPVPPRGRWALAFFAAYVAWSFLSITWAASPGDALQGSNRALLYLLIFAVALYIPWSPRVAWIALVGFALGIGILALVLMLRLASGSHVASLFLDSRLAAPTGYFNATAALFSLGALLSISLASRSELPGLIRGALTGGAALCLQLAVVSQSRGWLFTLPLVAVAATLVSANRLRLVAAAILPVAAALVPLHRLLHLYAALPPQLDSAAISAGHLALASAVAALVLATVLAWLEGLVRPRWSPVSAGRRRALGVAVSVVIVGAAAVGGVGATHGHPVGFITRQWNGFSTPPRFAPRGSHFATVGSGRYDFWRVSLDAFLAHPIGGLGQDNFAEYYLLHRRTTEEPAWTHSLEMRLLAHTGLVGAALFVGFLALALGGAVRARRSGPGRAIAASALMPFVVWLIQGSIDWFWEMPALTGPALGFLGLAIALGPPGRRADESRPPEARRQARRSVPPKVVLAGALGTSFLVAAALALGLPYLAVRQVSSASNLGAARPATALGDLGTAAQLNPLDAGAARLAGTIALDVGRFAEAENRFRQAESRDLGGWYAYLGEGLAASQLGQRQRARHAFLTADRLDRLQPAVQAALARVDSPHPLSPQEAVKLLILAE
jgi:hypothetical protein